MYSSFMHNHPFLCILLYRVGGSLCLDTCTSIVLIDRPMHLLTYHPQEGLSPLYQASKHGHTKIVDSLLKSGAYPNLATMVWGWEQVTGEWKCEISKPHIKLHSGGGGEEMWQELCPWSSQWSMGKIWTIGAVIYERHVCHDSASIFTYTQHRISNSLFLLLGNHYLLTVCCSLFACFVVFQESCRIWY